ncbi:hypothetical protein BGX28_002633 [Mortierella sp. GBA30]|nr:hypothetical protein BGX28_002633 [Mortierella sp. GBA30]
MKFLAVTISAAALFSVVSADMLQINNPTEGTEWKTDVPNFVGWTGNCASMGPDAKTVKVDLVNGPSNAVRYVATLGTLDCSGSNTRADMTVPSTVASGDYAIVIRTAPQQSYTNSFKINNPSQPAPANPTSPSSPAPPASGAAPAAPAGSGASASKYSSNALVALAGTAAMAFYLL